MRLAVFTSKYPAKIATFFERDMRALIESGVEIDVFAIKRLDSLLAVLGAHHVKFGIFSRLPGGTRRFEDCLRRRARFGQRS